ncbi:MAG TPA: tetratricopeptide repeat protein [Polyangiaceae bacterium]|nr:tetratricopeptide repeat protein [Polyangiaceae bacterium]
MTAHGAGFRGRERRAKGIASLVAMVACGLAVRALAAGHAPTQWDIARNPAVKSAEATHRQVELLLITVEQVGSHSLVGKEKLLQAMLLLDEAKADVSPDVRLRLDFGVVASDLGDDKRAAPVLESALAEAPEGPVAVRAWFSLGVSYTRLGRPDDEIRAWDEFLRRETHVPHRADALSNRAEALMLTGRLPAAIADYRASIGLHPDDVMAHWGLAVALDRNGDTLGAMAEARAAITYDPLDQKMTSDSVFFVPSYELYWYEGVGAMARAQQVDDAATAVLWWETAVSKWMEYIAVSALDDKWLPLARAHQASSQRELDRAKKRAAKSPKKAWRGAPLP